MSIAGKVITFVFGLYVGAYLDQNYELPKVPSPSEFEIMIMNYLDRFDFITFVQMQGMFQS
jgi:hypothetical protein